jgi:hypothetical protein
MSKVSKYKSIKSNTGSSILISQDEMQALVNTFYVQRKSGLFKSLKQSFRKIDFAKFKDTIAQTRFLPTKIDKASLDEASGKLIAKLIEAISSEYRLLPNIAKELKSLEAYYQILVSYDSSFLYDLNHPGRHFIDLICRESLAFRSENDVGQKDFHTVVKLIVVLMVGSKLHPLKTLDKASEWIEHRLTVLKTSRATDLNSMKLISSNATRRNAMARQLATKLAKYHPSINTQPLYIKDFIRNQLSNLIADYEINHTHTESVRFKTKVSTIVFDLLTTTSSHSKRPSAKKYQRECDKIYEDLEHVFDESAFGQSCCELDFFIGNLTRHHKYLLAVSLSPLHQNISRPAFLSESETESFEDSRLILTRNEKQIFGIPSSDMSATESEAKNFTSCLVEPKYLHGDVAGPQGVLFKDIDNILDGSHFDFFVNKKWQRFSLKWASNMADKKATMFMFKKLSGDIVTMTRRQFLKLIDLDYVYLVSRTQINSNDFDNVIQESISLT